MSFIEDLRRAVELVAQGAPRPVQLPDLSPVATRVIESWLAKEPFALQGMHARWLEGDLLEDVGEALATTILQRWPNLSHEEQKTHVEQAVEFAIMGEVSPSLHWEPQFQLPDGMERGRFILLDTLATSVLRRGSRAAICPHRYARDLGFVADGELTPSGQVMRRLQGVEAIRWVIASEIARSAGPTDMRRCSADVACNILGVPVGHNAGTEYDQHLDRFEDLGLVSDLEILGEGTGYRVTPLGGRIFEDLTHEPRAPLYSAAAALIADSSISALRQAGVLEASTATDLVEHAMENQTRGLVHELRNKLHPLQTAVATLSQHAEPSARTAKAADLARHALNDLFAYIDSMSDVASALSARHQWFHLGAALRDGMAQGRNGNRDVRSIIAANADAFEVLAPRMELVQAVANLVRNSIQSDARTVSISALSTEGALVLGIEDDGKGVQEVLRERVFEPGFTTRPGGSGAGLSLVRDLVQRTLGGTVGFEDSDHGGARLRISIPTSRVRPNAAEPKGGAA